MIKKLYSSFNGNRCTYCSNLLKMTDVTAHQEGSGSHEEVQHSPSQHRNIGLLPGQRLQGRPAVEKIDTWKFEQFKELYSTFGGTKSIHIHKTLTCR